METYEVLVVAIPTADLDRFLNTGGIVDWLLADEQVAESDALATLQKIRDLFDL